MIHLRKCGFDFFEPIERWMATAPFVTLLLLLLTRLVVAQTTGVVSGCITDLTQKPLPRATVTATASGNRRIVTANDDGCYEFSGLPSNLYRITARLTGFDNVTHDKVRVMVGRTSLNFTLTTSPICDCETPGRTLRELTERVDAVVYVRIRDRERELTAPSGYFQQMADVIEVLKYDVTPQAPLGAATKALHSLLKSDPTLGAFQPHLMFLQDQAHQAPEPYQAGEEYVLFLHWWEREHMYEARTRHAMHRSDRDTVFVIRHGRVARSPTSLTRFTGQPVEALLTELRGLSQ